MFPSFSYSCVCDLLCFLYIECRGLFTCSWNG